MKRPLLHGLAMLALAAGSPMAFRQQDPIRSGVELVLINVAVEAGNRPVGGLTAADFEVRDGEVAQNITATSLEALPLDLTLLLDMSGSVEGRVLRQLTRSVERTADWLKPADRVRVIAVEHVLRQIVPLQPAREPLVFDRLHARGGTALYDALVAAMVRTTPPLRRQLVVAYTDGNDVSSITRPAAALDIARLSDVAVYTMVAAPRARDRRAGAPPRRRGSADAVDRAVSAASAPSVAAAGDPQAVLREIAMRTGGDAIVLEGDEAVDEAFQQVLEEFRQGYVLSYVPTGVERGGWHDVSVRVVKPGRYQVRARRGYWGG